MGLVRLMQAGSTQFLASALRQARGSGSSASDQAPGSFADALAASSSAWPASEAHMAAAKQLDSCLEDLRARSSHGATLILGCTSEGHCLSCLDTASETHIS